MKKINATPAKTSTTSKGGVGGQVRDNCFQKLTLHGLWERKRSKRRMEGSRVGWKEEGFRGGVPPALCICFQDNTCLLPCYLQGSVRQFMICHWLTAGVSKLEWHKKTRLQPSREWRETKDAMREVLLQWEWDVSCHKKEAVFSRNPPHGTSGNAIKLLRFFSRGACMKATVSVWFIIRTLVMAWISVCSLNFFTGQQLKPCVFLVPYSNILNPTQDWWIVSRVWILSGMMKTAFKFQVLVYVVTSPHLGATSVRSTYQMMCHRISEVFACRVQIHPYSFWEFLSYLERCSVTCELCVPILI